MEPAVKQLGKEIISADSRLDKIAHLVNCYEKKVVNCNGNQTNVLKLLQSVTQVKEDYANLRQDLNEAQELQRQLHTTARFKTLQVRHRFQALRNKIATKAKK